MPGEREKSDLVTVKAGAKLVLTVTDGVKDMYFTSINSVDASSAL